MTAGDALYWVGLGLSVLLNVVLVALFLFKSALNQILADWFKTRAERKKQVRALLIELHGRRLEPFDTNYFLLLTNTHIQHAGPNEAVRKQAKATVESLAPSHVATLEFMSLHDLEFSSAIRQRIRDLRRSMELPMLRQSGTCRPFSTRLSSSLMR